MNKNDLIELKIEKLAYSEDGIGRTADGKTVFVPDTAPGDIIKAEIVSVNKSYAKAILKEIITPSESRIKPFCPLVKACGGCHFQHINYPEQLNAKKLMVQECINKISGLNIEVKDVIGNDEIREYRCKIQYPVQQTKVSKRFLAGYYKKNTHDIVNIKYCPIQPRIIDEIVEFLRVKASELDLTAYDEKTGKGLIRHFVIRYSRTNNNLLLTIVINADNSDLITKLCESAINKFPEITGVLANFNTKRSNIIMGKQTELIAGTGFIEEILDEKIFRISAESFFQINPLAAKKMFSEVRKIISARVNLPSILDVYSGSGSFSIFLSDIASEITAVEESEHSVNDGLENLKLNNIKNIKFINGKAEEVLADLACENNKYDVIILDPPRKGCPESVLENVKKLTAKYLVYISCNPSTLARDIKIISDSFTPEFIQPVDMFCHTYHIESIALLKKR